ncbi:hypothetical protein SAZ11_14955 [Streptomyces sp. FXJ1.4098]|uniref:hypothetical protein n=1 Tax=Streptomyces sp. NPDC020845 TaxID=3365096 RepID=UPI0029913DCA|nr:hypothetical protein [Streptomyces sp. FXJ1.4098]
MGLSTSTPLATGTDRGFDRTRAVEPFGLDASVHAGTRNPDRPHPVSGHELTGVRERVTVSGGGAP